MALLSETKKRGTGAREFVNNFRLYLTVFNSLICYRAIVCLYNIFYATHSIRRTFPIFFDRNGPEWYKLRTASAKKMLKIQEVSEYCTDMSEVAEDFTQVLLERRNKDNEVVGLKEEVFKWAMECELC